MFEAIPSELLIATRNHGKLAEAAVLLGALPLRLRSLAEFPLVNEAIETGYTFADNAVLKATSYAVQTGHWALADDSGIEVEALNNAPGVYSARYGGEDADDESRNALLLDELARTGDEERRARFVCVVAMSDPRARIINVSLGTCEGRIAHEPQGTNGFGYDPIFIPHGYNETFGQLSSDIKRRISHRAKALEAVSLFLCYQFKDLV